MLLIGYHRIYILQLIYLNKNLPASATATAETTAGMATTG